MNRNEIFHLVGIELKRAKRLHPNYPDHVVAQAATVSEKSGELLKTALEFKYEKGEREMQGKNLEVGAIRTIAAAIRFLENLK